MTALIAWLIYDRAERERSRDDGDEVFFTFCFIPFALALVSPYLVWTGVHDNLRVHHDRRLWAWAWTAVAVVLMAAGAAATSWWWLPAYSFAVGLAGLLATIVANLRRRRAAKEESREHGPEWTFS